MPTEYFGRVYRGESKRLDKALPLLYPDLNYRQLAALLRRRDVFVDGARQGEQGTVQDGQSVSLYVTPAFVGLKVIYQNEYILVLYKPKGVASEGEYSFEGLARFCFGDVRLMHRLDTNTDGLLLFCKGEAAYDAVYRYMKEGKITKYYRALVWGKAQTGELKGYLFKDGKTAKVYVYDEPVKGAVAVSCNVLLSRVQGECSEVEILLHGGKTHQLRAQLAHSGHFILGDGKYGDDRVNRRLGYKKQQLTAYRLVFDADIDEFGLGGLDVSLPRE